jgi:hypothetical protein
MSMGSRGDWISVAVLAAIWILFEALYALGRADAQSEDGVETVWSKGDLLLWILGGLFFGIALTFDWQALRSPIVLLAVVAFGGILAVAAFLRLRTKAKPNPPTAP